jgi:aminoglycoside 2''-phosphotransferase
MKNPTPAYLRRIHEIMPELQLSSVRAGEDGLVHDVLIVNEEWVFRFSRTAEGCRALEREARLLALVQGHVSLPVPELVIQSPTCLVYRFIPGIPLTRHDLLTLDPRARTAVLEQLGTFLHDLHKIGDATLGAAGPVADPGLRTRQDYQRLYDDIERELLPHMMAWARVWVREHFRAAFDGSVDFTYTPAFIHGDIAPYHLCYDPRVPRLVGVIDFGEAGSGDPAADLASVINAYGESLLWQMEPVYSEIKDLIDRARFVAGTLELRWGLAAIRSRDPAWFLCHLGYARDAGPIGWRPVGPRRKFHHSDDHPSPG